MMTRPRSGRSNPAMTLMKRGLARAGMPEKRDEPALGGELGIEREIAEPLKGADLDHAAIVSPRPALRARNSEVKRAAIEMKIDIAVSRSAPASPPGTCVNV